MKKNALLVLLIVIGLIAVFALSRALDARSTSAQQQFAEEPLYVNGATAKRLTLAFNGLAADWYWLRSLQYVGNKIVTWKDTHNGQMDFGSLSNLDLRLLPSLLQMTTSLDPQFMAPYEYGAMILPEINSDYAIALLNSGISANPSSWRLYHHLGYIYWKRNDYQKAGEIYAAGAKLPGAPPWMLAMSARMKAQGGSREAAREMYQHLYDSSNDEAVKQMVEKQMMRLAYLDEREAIQNVLKAYQEKNGRCPSSWRDLTDQLLAVRIEIGKLDNPSNQSSFPVVYGFKLDVKGAPLDPSGTPYELIKNGCDVDVDINTKVPLK